MAVDKKDAKAEQDLTAQSSTDEQIEIVEAKDEAAEELRQQVAQLRQSEQAAKDRASRLDQERAQALQRVSERDAEVADLQKQSTQSQLDVVSSALAAANAAASAAQRDLESAIMEGDAKSQAEAHRRLARAEADIGRLEDGKAELEARAKERPAEPKKQEFQPHPSDDPIERTNLPDTAKTWLRSHPDYLTDHRKNAKLQSLHWDVVDEGHAAFSTAYFESIEKHLGLRETGAIEDRHVTPRRDTSVVSAPVSRAAPNANTGSRSSKITLTEAQKEFAKISGVTEIEYAKGLQKLAAEKANGNYGGQP